MVHHARVVDLDVPHRGLAEGAGVAELTSRLRVEGRAVENDGGRALKAPVRDHASVEAEEERVVVEEQPGVHAHDLPHKYPGRT